ncbi:MAG: hypothetical protein KDA83_06250 [Planctomycetales bacterium]|nr:hypothetical protein [Planctomycetales bacterium]
MNSVEPEQDGPNSFERQAHEKPPGLVAEFWEFLVTNKRWWLIPIVVSLVLFGLLLALASQSVIAPLIYPLF